MTPPRWFSVQQVLAEPKGTPGKPKATSDEVTSNLEPLPKRLVTDRGHLQEDQARLETQLQKLQVQVTPHCCSTLALGHRAPNSPRSPPQAPLGPRSRASGQPALSS